MLDKKSIINPFIRKLAFGVGILNGSTLLRPQNISTKWTYKHGEDDSPLLRIKPISNGPRRSKSTTTMPLIQRYGTRHSIYNLYSLSIHVIFPSTS